jgi:hypothetical protein
MHKIATALGITLSELVEKQADGVRAYRVQKSTASGGYALPAFALMPHLVPVTVTNERAAPAARRIIVERKHVFVALLDPRRAALLTLALERCTKFLLLLALLM